MSGLRVEWISDQARFDELARPWDELADGHRLPFGRHAWFGAWWEAFGGGKQLQVCAVWDGDTLVAALPLEARRRSLRALANAQTPIFVPLGNASALGVAIAAAVARCSDLRLRLLPGPVAAQLSDRTSGRSVLVQADYAGPIVETSGRFDDYCRHGIERKTRKDIERRRRRLESVHEVVMELSARPRDLDAELGECLALEAAGWKGRNGTAILNSTTTLVFYRRVAEAFHAADRVRFCRLRVDGRLAAFDLALLDYDRLWLLKGAYDEDLRAHAPGLVLTLAEIEHCFAEPRVEALELLGDGVRWKLAFSNASRPLTRVHVARDNPLSAARHAYWRHLRPRLRQASQRLLRDRGVPAFVRGFGR